MSRITLFYQEEEEEEEECPHQGEDFWHEVGDPTSQISPAMSVANRDISLDTAPNTVGTNLMVAKRASRKHTTTTSKRNPSKWHERWQTLAIRNRRPKIGSTEWQEKVTK